MSSFIIRTEDGRDLGFLLFAGSKDRRPSSGKHDCIFMGIPFDASLLDDPGSHFITEHKGREWSADVSYAGTEMTAVISLDTGWTFHLLGHEEDARWTARHGGDVLEGTGLFL
ncbi:hypothetical protein LOC54_05095 [Acetobacter sp. AN02]|uniref:hypothetical protein n=1 Tax=Acetobacter sp. AN02 TaxID=2894186 RepID=UPI0024344CD5|nr:hypothetical protein [Acetobacter sp. AN02]MDG6094494.1 hypothetical protein [Acetobacter sp. AN02]